MLSKGSSCCCSFDDYKLTTEWLQNQTRHRPKVAVICGSGLGLLAEAAADKQTFRYQDIPNFPVSTVPGHEGCLVFGTIEETPCVFMKGHFHLYEGYSLCQVTFPVRIFKLRLLVCPGMSMVPEVTVAKHCGLRVLGLTLVTNKVSLDYSREEKVNHDEVLEICKMRAELLQKLVSTLIGRCQQNINTH
ncbi:PREDICTED: purine nucleoside phosphorylase-like [Poecilia mexicana]|uniref:purine nucleoside phosphorylase-like n=1 Tax=Poecilia mexicana TaxID=48701 RepID=UPI00072E6080|nr:PREDICTED: purine nucleoside phosphorylase-like [Poecilia mexicana]